MNDTAQLDGSNEVTFGQGFGMAKPEEKKKGFFTEVPAIKPMNIQPFGNFEQREIPIFGFAAPHEESSSGEQNTENEESSGPEKNITPDTPKMASEALEASESNEDMKPDSLYATIIPQVPMVTSNSGGSSDLSQRLETVPFIASTRVAANSVSSRIDFKYAPEESATPAFLAESSRLLNADSALLRERISRETNEMNAILQSLSRSLQEIQKRETTWEAELQEFVQSETNNIRENRAQKAFLIVISAICIVSGIILHL